MKIHRMIPIAPLLAALLFVPPAGKIALAQDDSREVQEDQGPPRDVPRPGDDDQNPAQDPPGRVAQLSYASGSVSFQPSGQGDWVQAVTNRPLTV